MKYLSCITLLLCVICFNVCSAQNDFWNSSDDTPEIFASELLKDNGVALDRLAFSADGKGFYYCEKWDSAPKLHLKFSKKSLHLMW